MTVTTARLLIGGADGRDAFFGTIDEVAIYPRRLSGVEIETHHGLGRGP